MSCLNSVDVVRIPSLSKGLVTSYKSSRLLIFIGGVPLLELSLEEKEEEVELVGVCGGVTIGS
jgi:hypothetical protein